jgi:SAM-dependent methyltransferase
MSFAVAAESYDRYMGRYSSQLSPAFADLAGVAASGRSFAALDVGCGPGALTAELVRRLGPAAVAAVDPSESFVTAVRARQPGVDVRLSSAEALPFPDRAFDAALAQLVVHLMRDPAAGVAEMARVTRPGGVVAACVWDLAGGRGPVSTFWRAVRALDGEARDESALAGVRAGDLVALLAGAGLRDVVQAELTASLSYAGFEDWWQPFTLGVGPTGAYLEKLDEAGLAALRAECRRLLPEGPFEVRAVAWAARGVVASG